ncbi:hypothetical protein DXG03_007395 [Asterophora parasitica]|uniref:Peptidase S8/S53 domain-containing protein n=1 Tax=Asterophora parasitica TaxID=117018 RepID=A0A9P7G8Y1_9AGAR|nr:hypothetical protein DXG03_007395 [Asterophora parasitica]
MTFNGTNHWHYYSISGINFIKTSAAASGRPSVILAPVGGGASAALDSAVVAATSAGVHFVTTAGNSNADASNFSPGRVPSAITVGASTIADTISSSSNYGPAIKLFAPGQSVLSTWIGSPDATNIISGGSSAAAHVAGLAAYLLGILGTTSTITLGTALETTAVRGALTNVPAGTVNLLANNNIARLGLKL